MTEEVDFRALFIGDQAENGLCYKKLLNRLVDEHLEWRENYLSSDLAAITKQEQQQDNFIATKKRMESVLEEVSQRLCTGSVPWNSAGRYWGQMNSETLMPSLLAYNLAMLWNPNNVATESSMATSQMEFEVGQDFARLFSQKKGWGHICADGSIANLEGLWYARCIKSIPLAIKKVFPNMLHQTEWELLNMPTEQILQLVDSLSCNELEEVKAVSSRSGKNIQKLGKWIVPQTKHYSWLKALDISGVGLDQMITIPIQENYRMDIEKLEETLVDLVAKKIPILGVVAVVGTTEEGQVDNVDQIVAIREKLKKEGYYFYLHVDAAYGGYARSIFLDEKFQFIPYEDLQTVYQKHKIFTSPVMITKEVYDSFKAISEAESITIDPHKMGYIPYSAGGITIKYKNMRNIISYFAPYIFEKSVHTQDLLGPFILEGSKAGATAAAVWTAHRILPLNITGYGHLTGASIESAQKLRTFLGNLTFNIKGKKIQIYPLNHPDFNMVDWVFKEEGNGHLVAINELSEQMFDHFSYLDGDIYGSRFITSHTTFTKKDYGDSPIKFIESIGLNASEWKKVEKLTLLRASIMTPYLTDEKVFNYYTQAIYKAMEGHLNDIFH